MVAMLLFVNLVLGVISRVAPQINIFAIGFPITLGVGLLGHAADAADAGSSRSRWRWSGCSSNSADGLARESAQALRARKAGKRRSGRLGLP